MTLIVEDGTGIYQSNSYVGRGFVRSYLRRRNKATAWDAATEDAKIAALIAATDYIDRRFGKMFRGQREFTALTVPDYDILDIISNPTNNRTVTVGSVTYTFRVSASSANEVTIGSTAIETAENLTAAINGTGGGSGTVAHPDVTASVLDSGAYVMVEAIVTPLAAAIETSSSDESSLVWDKGTLSDGGEDLTQRLEWPRVYAYNDSGVLLNGIPLKLKEATAEYASRALSQTLMPDPVVGDTGQDIRRTFEKVGPIETETVYSTNVVQIFKKFPEADRLLLELINSGYGVYR